MRPSLLAAILIAACATARAGDAPVLHARFTLAPGLGWTAVRIDPAAADWRIGSVDGPRATPGQVREVLARLSRIAVGARCAGWVEGPTGYPCGFAVEADRPGAATFRAQNIGWQPTPEGRARTADRATPELRAAGLIAPLPDAPAFVAVELPTEVLGRVLELRIRPLSNALVPSSFDRDSGAVVLHGGRAVGSGA